MATAERSRQILEGAIQFFAVHGFDGQLRDLAKSIGITHALLYHYYPTKQALIDSVYQEVFVERWNPQWDELLDDASISVEDKLTRFYADYINNALSRDFVRILVFSGLTDRTITDRFFAMLRERLFPRLIRETRRFRGARLGGKTSTREMELLMGLHGSFFYVTMQRWVYGQTIYNPEASEPPLSFGLELVRDRIRSYLLASAALFTPGEASPVSSRRPQKGRSSSRKTKETT
jgi:AcrR family transcriptional regulator